MIARPRTAAAVGSVSSMALAMIVAVALGPPGPARLSLSVMGLFAIAVSITAVVANPRDLLAATVLGLPPIMALGSDGPTGWLIVPVSILLLVAGELNAFCWELEGPRPKPAAVRWRATGILQLSLLGLAASTVVVTASRLSLLTGTGALAVAALALVGAAWVILPGGAPQPPPDDSG